MTLTIYMTLTMGREAPHTPQGWVQPCTLCWDLGDEYQPFLMWLCCSLAWPPAIPYSAPLERLQCHFSGSDSNAPASPFWLSSHPLH